MPTSFKILLVLYVTVGPLAWVGLLSLILLGRSRMTRLIKRHSSSNAIDADATLPTVSVIVPARDEGKGIRRCIERIRSMDYPTFDIIAIDDRSRDETASVLHAMADESSKVRLIVKQIHDGELPDGWMGKCNALNVGTRDVKSEWLLFIDSDVIIDDPTALRDAIELVTCRNYDALSIFTRLECHTPLERMMLPLAAGAWAMIFQASLTNDDNRPDVAVANGQFFLIRRDAYEKVGGHAAVRDQIVEDVELMRTLKREKFRVRFQFGSHLASTRMHSTLRQMFHGWGRIFSGTARRHARRLIAAVVFIAWTELLFFIALIIGLHDASAHADHRWLAAAVAHGAIILVVLVMIYAGSRNPKRYALLAPISAPLLVTILIYSIRLCRTGRVPWRGSIAKLAPRET